MSFVLIYDIPFGLEAEKRKINRQLNKVKAKRLQQSLWRHNDIKILIELGETIRKIGGSAEILEERFLF